MPEYHGGPPSGELHQILGNGEVVAFFAAEYKTFPFAFHYIKNVEVSPQKMNKGVGKALVDKVNNFLDENNSCGILFNGISGPAKNMYSKAGWREVPKHPGWLVHNAPDNVSEQDWELAI